MPALAQTDFPNKPVTLVTAFAPGSGPDAVLRLVAEKLGKTWNQRVLVENKPGGGGFIAMDSVKRAAPDGYTLLQLDSEHLSRVAAPVQVARLRHAENLRAGRIAVPNAVHGGGAQRLEMEVDGRHLAAAKAKAGQADVWLVGRGQPWAPRRGAARDA